MTTTFEAGKAYGARMADWQLTAIRTAQSEVLA